MFTGQCLFTHSYIITIFQMVITWLLIHLFAKFFRFLDQEINTNFQYYISKVSLNKAFSLAVSEGSQTELSFSANHRASLKPN